MYYEIKGYNAVKPVDEYCNVAYNKGEKETLVKQYKEYLKSKELDMFKVVSHRNDGELKSVITYA